MVKREYFEGILTVISLNLELYRIDFGHIADAYKTRLEICN